MDTIQVNSFIELMTLLRSPDYCCGHVVYRGVKDSVDHKLIPSVGRLDNVQGMTLAELISYESEILKIFRQRAYGEMSKIPSNDLVWLALAQHHGLPTRLLDWTASPLVALYFATEPNLTFDGKIGELPKNGGALYVLHDCDYIDGFNYQGWPIKPQEHKLVYSPVVTNRISGQSGLFTIHNDPREEFHKGFTGGAKWIHKIEFSQQVATDIQKALYFLGVRKGSIYPDIDGFASDTRIRFAMSDSHTSSC